MRTAMRRGSLAVTLAAIAAIGLAALSFAKTYAGHEEFHWSGAIRPGQTLEVHGINGNVVCEGTAGSSVVVNADKYGRKNDPSEVEIKVIQDKEGVLICAVYPGVGNACERDHVHSNIKHNDVQVNFTVRVPAGVKLVATTVNGDTRATGLDGPVKARAVNGSCTIETSGTGEAASVNGNVTATIGPPEKGDELEFASVNGNVTLNAPRGLDADVVGSTVNGGIDSDFPVTVQGRWGPRSMHGVIGNGGARLRFSTVNGTIKLRRRSVGT